MQQIGQQHEKGFGKGGCFVTTIKWGFIGFLGLTAVNIVYRSFYDFFTKFELRGVTFLAIVSGLYYLFVRFTGKNPLFKLFNFKGLFSKVGTVNSNSKGDEYSLNGRVTIENPFAGIFICGGAGSGKSKSIIEPLIKESGNKGYSGVIYDFKYPELGEYVATAYKNGNVKPYFIDFVDVSKSNRVNPIAPEFMTSMIKAQELAFAVMVNLDDSLKSKKGDSFFSQSAVALLTACMWYLRQKFPEYCTLPHAVSMIISPDSKKLIETLASYSQTAEIISPILSAHTSGAEKQLAGQLSSAQLPLQKINTPEIFWVLSDADFNLDLNNKANPSILTIGNNPSIQDSLSPVIALIMTATMKLLNQPNKEKSVFMVDEFPTIYIPNVEQLPATARSNKVSTVLACQDISQVVDGYGKEKADTILSNLGNQFYGRTTNVQTAERVSKIFGKYDKKKVSKSAKTFITNNRTTTYQEADLVKATDVFQAQTGSFYTLLSSGNKRLGISAIQMDNNFKKSAITLSKNVTDADVHDNFDKIKEDIRMIVLA